VGENSPTLVKGTIPAFALDGLGGQHRSSVKKGGVPAETQTGHFPI